MNRPPLARRAALLAVMALVLLATPFAADAATTDTGDGARRAIVDLSGAIDATTTIQATSVPAEATGIGPGSHLLIEMDGGLYGCTASWVYESGGELLLGAAGHCFLPPDKTATHGRDADYDPAGTRVRVCVSGCTNGGQSGFKIEGNTVELGEVAYARQEKTDGGDRVGWDFGVVEIPTRLHDLVRTTMPVFGGPGRKAELSGGHQVCHYGNGVVVGEIWPTMGRTGVGISSDDDAWYATSPAAPGDSGSAVQTCTLGSEGLEGVGAVGTLTHLTFGGLRETGVAGTTNAQAIEMAKEDASLALTVVLGAVPTGGGTGSTDGGSTDDGSTDDGGPGNGNGGGNGKGKGKPTA